MPVTIFVPADLISTFATPPDGTTVAYADAAGLERDLRTTSGGVVLWSDGVAAGDADTIAAAVRERDGTTIEVRSERWDGFAASPLSAAARGVISGFGAAGVRAAVALLLAHAPAAAAEPPASPEVRPASPENPQIF